MQGFTLLGVGEALVSFLNDNANRPWSSAIDL